MKFGATTLNKKHAYLIMAHNHADLLNRLLNILDDPRNDVFVHIDSKSGDAFVQRVRRSLNNANLYFTERVDVHWGAFSLVQAEMALLKLATDTGNYAYYHLISGVDLPIKTQDQIHTFFDSIQGQELVQFQQPKISAEKLERVRRYFPLQEKDIRINQLLSFSQRVLVKAQKILGMDRLRHVSTEFQMGSNWFSITDDFARYIIQALPQYVPYFQNAFCSDELIVQTILINSPFKESLYHTEFDDSKQGNMRFIVWLNHAPRDIVSSDYQTLKSSDLLFARKFNPDNDPAIIEKVITEMAQ